MTGGGRRQCRPALRHGRTRGRLTPSERDRWAHTPAAPRDASTGTHTAVHAGKRESTRALHNALGARGGCGHGASRGNRVSEIVANGHTTV